MKMKSGNKGAGTPPYTPKLERKNKEVSVSPRKPPNIHSPLKDTSILKPESTDKDTVFKRVTVFGSL